MSQARDLWIAFFLLLLGGVAIVTAGFAGLLLAAPATILAGFLILRGTLESQALLDFHRVFQVFFSRRVSALHKLEAANAWRSLLWNMAIPTTTPFLLLIPGVFLPDGLARNIVLAMLGGLIVIMLACLLYGLVRIISIHLFLLSKRGREQMTREAQESARNGDIER
jgi:hypothetical protein